MADSTENADDSAVVSCGDGTDSAPTLEELQTKVTSLEAEQEKLHREFGTQRAKYRELYQQKEEELLRVTAENQKLASELEEVRNELAALNLERNERLSERSNCEGEVASLQKVLEDTLEENSNLQRYYEERCSKLEAELERRDHPPEDRERSSDPLPIHKITQVTKSLARKVMELGVDSSSNLAKETLEDEARKAQEDAEALRALLIPLEDQIENLKEKLRDADDRLQKYEKQSSGLKSPLQESQIDGANKMSVVAMPQPDSQEALIQLSPTSPMEPAEAGSISNVNKTSPQENKDLEAFLGSDDVSTIILTEDIVPECEKCRQHETTINNLQQQLTEVQKALEYSENAVQRARDDLNKERTSRQEMENKWNGIKDQYDEQVASLKETLSKCEMALLQVQKKYREAVNITVEKLDELKQENMLVVKEIKAVQARNENILGKYYIHSSELQVQVIDLPDTVPELHELLLHEREELIAAKTAAEMHEEEVNIYRSELQLRERELDSIKEKELKYKYDLTELEKRLEECRITNQKHKENEVLWYNKRQDMEKRLNTEINNKKKLEKEIHDYQQKLSSLQKSVSDSEIVQKDFVCLSQTLQKQLEELRTEGTEVRWQHDEDVDMCPTCKNTLRHNREKVHCRHCGKIFCHNCLTYTVESGPRRRPSHVCQVCHTLLKPNSAPYFCKEPPSAPD